MHTPLSRLGLGVGFEVYDLVAVLVLLWVRVMVVRISL